MFTLSMKTVKVLYLSQIFNFLSSLYLAYFSYLKVIHKVIVYFIKTFKIYTSYLHTYQQTLM